LEDTAGAQQVDDEYLIGDCLLVAPIVNGLNTRDVYVPAGDWAAYNDTTHVFHGPQTLHSIPVPIHSILFYWNRKC
jgi:alpha-D-xyloside xylohydrolase